MEGNVDYNHICLLGDQAKNAYDSLITSRLNLSLRRNPGLTEGKFSFYSDGKDIDVNVFYNEHDEIPFGDYIPEQPRVNLGMVFNLTDPIQIDDAVKNLENILGISLIEGRKTRAIFEKGVR